MKRIGSYMALFGIFAIILGLMGRVSTVLTWMYNWGDTVAWAIKIALVVGGIALYYMSAKSEAK